MKIQINLEFLHIFKQNRNLRLYSCKRNAIFSTVSNLNLSVATEQSVLTPNSHDDDVVDCDNHICT